MLRRCTLLALFLAPHAWADSPTPARFASVRDQISTSIDNGDAPSVSVGVVENDRLIWAQSFGWADIESKEAATPDTIYRLASISKSFTGTGLMVLKDRGLVDLDAAANMYLSGEKLRTCFENQLPLTPSLSPTKSER